MRGRGVGSGRARHTTAHKHRAREGERRVGGLGEGRLANGSWCLVFRPTTRTSAYSPLPPHSLTPSPPSPSTSLPRTRKTSGQGEGNRQWLRVLSHRSYSLSLSRPR